MTVKKINTIIAECGECPYFMVFDYSDEVWCRKEDRGLPAEAYGSLVNIIPDWCTLDKEEQHYFLTDENDRFCKKCGKYMTHPIHKRG